MVVCYEMDSSRRALKTDLSMRRRHLQGCYGRVKCGVVGGVPCERSRDTGAFRGHPIVRKVVGCVHGGGNEMGGLLFLQ